MPDETTAIERETFQGRELARQPETAATAIAAAQKATIEARCIMAMQRPRNWKTVRVKLLGECERPGFAESAIYRKPVGKKLDRETGEWVQNYVEGLSVRFAEAALRYMTNFYGSATSIYDDHEKAIHRVTVMDLESNATIEIDVTVTKTVERRELKRGQRPLSVRTNSYGETVNILPATDDEVLNKANALISKALRNGVLRLLPGDIQDDCEFKCRATQRKSDKEDPGAALNKLFDGFAAIGVMPNQLADYLGVTEVTHLEPKQLGELRAIYAAIRDSETTWSEVMAARMPDAEATLEQKKASADVQAILERAGKGKGAPAPNGKAPEGQPADGSKPTSGEPQAAASDATPATPAEAPAAADAPAGAKGKGRKGEREPGDD